MKSANLLLSCAMLAGVAPALAQHSGHGAGHHPAGASPYAGEQARERRAEPLRDIPDIEGAAVVVAAVASAAVAAAAAVAVAVAVPVPVPVPATVPVPAAQPGLIHSPAHTAAHETVAIPRSSR